MGRHLDAHPPHFKMVLELVEYDGSGDIVVKCSESNLVLMRKSKFDVGFNVHDVLSELNKEWEGSHGQ